MKTVHVYVKTKSKNVNEEKTVTNSFQSSFVYSLRILYLCIMYLVMLTPQFFPDSLMFPFNFIASTFLLCITHLTCLAHINAWV